MYLTPGVWFRVMGVQAGRRITVLRLASIVRAQQFKANFSISVKLISAAATMCFEH